MSHRVMRVVLISTAVWLTFETTLRPRNASKSHRTALGVLDISM